MDAAQMRGEVDTYAGRCGHAHKNKKLINTGGVSVLQRFPACIHSRQACDDASSCEVQRDMVGFNRGDEDALTVTDTLA